MNFHNLAANQSEIRETSFSDPGIYRDPEIGDLSELTEDDVSLVCGGGFGFDQTENQPLIPPAVSEL